MSTIAPAAKIRVFTLPFYLRFVGIAAVTLAGLTYLAGGPENVLRHLIPAFAHPHLPDLDLIARAKPAIQLHLFAALIALGVGIWQIAGVKGGLQHRIVGWTWTVLMLTTAISALFIHETHPGGWSPIHLFSLLTLVTLPLAIYFVRTGKIAQHGRAMASLFLGGLILAGLITFAPGRLMWKLFFGQATAYSQRVLQIRPLCHVSLMRVRPSLASLTVLLNLLSAAAQAGDLKPRAQVEVTLDARVGELHVTHHLPIAEILKAMPSPGADPQQALRTYIEANFYVHEPFGDAELAFVSAERRGDEMIVRYRGNLTPPSRALTVRDTLFSEVDPTAPIHVVVRERNSVQTFDLTAAQPSKSVGFDAVSDEAF